MKTKEKDRIRKENISFVFQKNSLVRYLSQEDNLLLRNVTTAEKLPSDRFSSSSLSGGEEILIALAYEIAKEKKIHLFDEVFDALDSNHRKELCSFLEELSRTSLVLLVSHVIRLFFRKQKEYRSLRNGRGSEYEYCGTRELTAFLVDNEKKYLKNQFKKRITGFILAPALRQTIQKW